MATVLFASKTDIQSWLQSDKILVDDANSQKQNIDATRIVKGTLAGLFAPIVIASWVGPEQTPGLIRSVTGQLTAAFMYAGIYSEENDREVGAYAQWLYDQAMYRLAQIVAGNLTVTDDDGGIIETEGTGLLSFFPNDTTAPLFSINQIFN